MIFFGNPIEKLIREVTINLRSLAIDPKTAVVANIDTINGLFLEGCLSSYRLTKIIPKIVKVNDFFLTSQKVFFVDVHTSSSVELSTFPNHCISDREQKIIKELEPFKSGADIFTKNSTNPFIAHGYVKWLIDNVKDTETYVIVGGNSDISIMQYALSQKTYLNDINSRARVVVVENAIQTFDNDAHDGNLMHSFALYNMYINGIILATI